MLTFAAIAPHSLDLLKTPKKAPGTIAALAKLQQSFTAAKSDVTIIISPHGAILEKSFAINLAQEYELDLKELGVKTEKRTFKSEPLTTIAIRKARLTDANDPVTLVSAPKLDYGTAVPLSFLCGKGECAVIPVSHSLHAMQDHYAFGETMREEIMGSTKRFAVIASATLAHGSDGQSFDERIIKSLQSDDSAKNLFPISDDELKKLDVCGLRPIVMLLGILQGLPWDFVQLAYERPFDTGLLVAEFHLKT